MLRNVEARVVFLVFSLALASGAWAHTGQGPVSGLAHGFNHPLGGLDHALAMLAVGLWAAQMGGRATWLVPLSFVGVMVIGGLLGMVGMGVPFVETGILVSVFFLGALVLLSARLPLWASMVLVGLFALFHGHAHGAEMPQSVSGIEYALGFVLATALLHLAGLAVGYALSRTASVPDLRSLPLLRALGALVMLGGVVAMWA